jgi:hypothetical protein
MTVARLEEDLDNYLEEVEDPTGGYPLDGGERPWKPTDDSAADWCLRKLARARAQRAEVDNLLKERIEHLRRWHEDATAPLAKEEGHWLGLLEDYALWRREETGAKSVKLPNGELATRLQRAAVEITDAKALLAWLDDQDADLMDRWCKLEPQPQVSRLKEDVAITPAGVCYEGEVIPGLGVRPDVIKVEAHT